MDGPRPVLESAARRRTCRASALPGLTVRLKGAIGPSGPAAAAHRGRMTQDRNGMLVLARDSAWAGAGWILGHKIDGTQAEHVHMPFADTLTYPAPAGVTDEQLLTLADTLPTGYESACPTTRSGPATWSTWSGPARSDCRPSWEPGSTAPATSWPSTRPTPGSKRPSSSARCQRQQQSRQDALAAVQELTRRPLRRRGHRGHRRARHLRARRPAHPPGRARRQHRRARRAGHAAPRGPLNPRRHHHHRAGRHLLDPDAAQLVCGHRLDAGRLVTHHHALDDFDEAYDVFARAGETGVLKVLLSRP